MLHGKYVKMKSSNKHFVLILSLANFGTASDYYQAYLYFHDKFTSMH